MRKSLYWTFIGLIVYSIWTICFVLILKSGDAFENAVKWIFAAPLIFLGYGITLLFTGRVKFKAAPFYWILYLVITGLLSIWTW